MQFSKALDHLLLAGFSHTQAAAILTACQTIPVSPRSDLNSRYFPEIGDIVTPKPDNPGCPTNYIGKQWLVKGFDYEGRKIFVWINSGVEAKTDLQVNFVRKASNLELLVAGLETKLTKEEEDRIFQKAKSLKFSPLRDLSPLAKSLALVFDLAYNRERGAAASHRDAMTLAWLAVADRVTAMSTSANPAADVREAAQFAEWERQYRSVMYPYLTFPSFMLHEGKVFTVKDGGPYYYDYSADKAWLIFKLTHAALFSPIVPERSKDTTGGKV